MKRLAVSKLIPSYRVFERDFWLSYKALERIMEPEKFNDIKLILLKNKRIDNKYLKDIDVKNYEAEKLIIDSEWKQENEEAKATGTAAHEYIHKLLSVDAASAKREYNIPTDQYQLMKTEEFLNTDKGIFSEFKMETQLDEDVTLVGIADLIIKDGNHLTIVEFKTDKKIDTKSRFDLGKYKSKTLRYPLNKFEDCNLVHYQFQLSLYAYLLQRLNPEFIIDHLIIMQIKDLKKYKEFEVVYLKDTVEAFLKWHVKDIKLKERLQDCKRVEYKEFLNENPEIKVKEVEEEFL